MIGNYVAAACAAAGLCIASPAWASADSAGCGAAAAHRLQLVCNSDACLRLETQTLCEAIARGQPLRAKAARPLTREERSARALDRLIASID